MSLVLDLSSFGKLRCCCSKKSTFILIILVMILLLVCYKMYKPVTIKQFLKQDLNKEMTMDDLMMSLKADLPQAPTVVSFQNSSSAWLSQANLEKPKAQYCVGEILQVNVQMRSHAGTPKTHGGDFILARTFSNKLRACASGVVTDFHNGSYRVDFPLFWPGEVEFSLLLMHSSEAVWTLWRYRQRDYTVIHTGIFVNGSGKENSQCGYQVIPDQEQCEYRDQRDKEFYTCLKPATLHCDSLKELFSVNNPKSSFTNEENKLLKRTEIGVELKKDFQAKRVIECPGATRRSAEKCQSGMMSPVPSGHFIANKWSSSYCQTGNFSTADSISSCLKGKTLYIWGDSTTRQWISYFVETVKGLKYIYRSTYTSPMLAADVSRNITIHWKKHGHPWVSSYPIKIDEGPYISRELDRIGGGQDVAVLIGVGQHFRSFPLEVFINRVLSIRRAIQRLHVRSPLTQVFIKLENTREHTSDMMRFSNWHGHLQNLAQRKAFGDLRVTIVDAWDISVADNTFQLHPSSNIVANQVAIFLSHLCPAP